MVNQQVLAYFHYFPSIGGCVFAFVAYTVVSIVIAYQTCTIRNANGRRANYMWIAVFTGVIEAAGYVARLITRQNGSLQAFIASLVLIILAPNFVALVNYGIIGKVGILVGVGSRFFNPRVISVIWFGADLLCICIQGGGAAIITQAVDNGKSPARGQSVVMVGLFIQLVFLGMFMLLTFYVGGVARRKGAANPVPIQVFICMWVTMILLVIRNVYRVVEYLKGENAYMNTHEVFFYALDFLPIILAFITFAVLPYGRYLPTVQKAPVPQQGQDPQSVVNLITTKSKQAEQTAAKTPIV